jgi:hypothetical protein
MLTLCLALIFAQDAPADFVPPPAGVVIPPAKPGAAPIEITVPFNPNAATRADLKALADRVAALENADTKAATASHGHTLATDKPCDGCVCLNPGDCGETGCKCRSAKVPVKLAAVKATAPKGWYTLTNYPGWQGYGALNAAGQVVVEQRRAIPVAAPQPALRYFYPQFQLPASSGCAGGNCYRR